MPSLCYTSALSYQEFQGLEHHRVRELSLVNKCSPALMNWSFSATFKTKYILSTLMRVGVKCYLSIKQRGCAHSWGTGSTADSIHAFKPQKKAEEKKSGMKKRGGGHQATQPPQATPWPPCSSGTAWPRSSSSY